MPKSVSTKSSYPFLTALLVIGAASAGAAAMYLFDARSGRGRRARIREQGIHARNVSLRRLGQKSRHWRNRAQGMMHQLIAGRADRAA